MGVYGRRVGLKRSIRLVIVRSSAIRDALCSDLSGQVGLRCNRHGGNTGLLLPVLQLGCLLCRLRPGMVRVRDSSVCGLVLTP